MLFEIFMQIDCILTKLRHLKPARGSGNYASPCRCGRGSSTAHDSGPKASI